MSSPNTPNSYRSMVDDATAILYDVSQSPRIDAEVLMQHTLQQPLAWLIAYGDSAPSKDHTLSFYEHIKRRQQGHPIAYITGHKEFWSLNLIVNDSVLIPRPDTEILVDNALNKLNSTLDCEILDLGTGSGAIALSLAKECPTAKIIATDSQLAALNIAKQNASRNKLENVCFLESDWFNNVPPQKFNLITSNPPYIEPNDEHLKQGDLRFEPSCALIGADDGLGDLKEIISNSISYLKKNGHLIVEHGYNQHEDVQRLFYTAGFKEIQTFQDLNDLPRCTAGKWLS